ncbi:MAG: hypothetical protein ACI4N3_02950 [Alphaproteobacteria bacterium]
MNKKIISVFDFDGTFYKTPTPDIPKLEDAIDLAMFKLLKDKLKTAKNKDEVLKKLNEKFDTLDKTQITPNLHNQNAEKFGPVVNYFGDKSKSFSDYVNESEGNKTEVIVARALAKMMEPNGAGNHRVSGMLNLGLDNISQKDIEDYYKKYATITYRNIERNPLIEKSITDAKQRGDLLFVYTDNSKNNVLSGMKTLDYDSSDFKGVIDMFDCDGGTTKKMKQGIDAFKEKMKLYCVANDVEYNLSNFRFYDDNPKICEFMTQQGIPSFYVSPTEIKQVENPNITNIVANKIQR